MTRRAFSFVEIMMVVLVLGILAAIVLPRFGGVTEDARAAALQSSLGGVRSSIASFRTRAVIEGTGPYPTLAELTSGNTVVQGEIPVNPFNDLNTVQAVSAGQAASRAVISPTNYGWNYFFNNSVNPPTAIFYANSTDATSVSDGAGGTLDANEF